MALPPLLYKYPRRNLPQLSLTASVGALLSDVNEPEAWVECHACEWENETRI